MTNPGSFTAAWAPRGLSVLRAVTGFLLLAHGTKKLLVFPAPRAGGGTELLSLLGVAGMLELAGGVLLLVGLCTRPVAFVLSGFTAVAYFMAHAPRGFWPLLNGGELAALYAFVLLYLCFAGGGPWSVDALLRRRS
jgi:putative oxidoreductase